MPAAREGLRGPAGRIDVDSEGFQDRQNRIHRSRAVIAQSIPIGCLQAMKGRQFM